MLIILFRKKPIKGKEQEKELEEDKHKISITLFTGCMYF